MENDFFNDVFSDSNNNDFDNSLGTLDTMDNYVGTSNGYSYEVLQTVPDVNNVDYSPILYSINSTLNLLLFVALFVVIEKRVRHLVYKLMGKDVK